DRCRDEAGGRTARSGASRRRGLCRGGETLRAAHARSRGVLGGHCNLAGKGRAAYLLSDKGEPMIVEAASAAAARLFTREFRAVLWKSLGLTILALIGLWFVITGVFEAFALPSLQSLLPDLPDWTSWFGWIAAILAGIALALGLGL